MTSLPAATRRKLDLVIDLDTCVGCRARAAACKEWNDGGTFGASATDYCSANIYSSLKPIHG